MKPNYIFLILILSFALISIGIVGAVNIKVTDNNAYTYIKSNSNITLNTYNQTWLEFDGVDDYVNAGKSNSLNQNYTKFTLSLWVKPNSLITDGTTTTRFLYKRNHFSMLFFNITGNIEVSTTGLSSQTNAFNKAVNNNEWNYLVFSYNGKSSLMFLNGELVRTLTGVTGVVNISSGDYELNFGGYATEYSLNGSLDDVILLNNSINFRQQWDIYYNYRHLEPEPIVPIFMHHRMGNSSISELYINDSQLITEMEFLNSSGYTCITDIDYLNWTKGNIEISEKSVMLIWDDGTDTVLTNASGIMANYSCRGVLAVPTALIDDDPLTSTMSWQNVSRLVNEYNWTIASHSSSHVNFVNSQLTNAQAISNFTVSKNDILINTGFNPVSFVFPYNSYNSTYTNLCANYYSVCFGSSNNLESYVTDFNTKYTNLTDGSLSRIGITNNTNITHFQHELGELNFDWKNINGTVGRWGFNENSGTTAYDVSGNSNNGTISGASWNNDGVLIANLLFFPSLNVLNNLILSPLSLLYDYLVSSSVPSTTYVLLNNTNSVDSYELQIYSLTNGLVFNPNGTIYGSSNINNNDGNINFTLTPKNLTYVLDNYNLTEGITRDKSPVNITGISTTVTSKSYSISSLVSEDIQIPIYLSIPTGYTISSVSLTPKGKSTYSPYYLFDSTSRVLSIPVANLSYSTSSSILVVGLTTTQQSSICTGFFGAGESFSSFFVIIIIIAVAGVILFFLFGDTSEIDLTTLAITLTIVGVMFALGMIIISAINGC